MRNSKLTLLDKLAEIHESIELIEDWSSFATQPLDFMVSPYGVMAFNACVMRLQVIGENVGKLLKDENQPLSGYDSILWQAIYSMRNLISHEYSNIDEEVVYSVIKSDLLPLKKAIESMMEKYC